MFNFIKDKIKKVYASVTQQVSTIFSRNKLDDNFLKELSMLLISADTGVKTTNQIIQKLKDDIKSTSITNLQQAKGELEKLLSSKLQVDLKVDPSPRVVLLVGVNGSGKTTFIPKFANLLKKSGNKVLVVAGDTFRAAATQQLEVWAKQVGVDLFWGKENQDPASVVFSTLCLDKIAFCRQRYSTK
jgi:fused signal recognition particle receptor